MLFGNLPWYISAMVLAAVIGILTATAVTLYRGAVTVGLPKRTGRAVALTAAGAWGAWIVVSAVLAGSNVYRASPDVARLGLPLAAGGSLIVALLAARIPVVQRILAEPRMPARLALPHTFRVVGVAFLIAMALDQLPAVFALPAGLGDIAVGIAAPFAAARFLRGDGRPALLWFNIVGLADLVLAVSIGFLAGQGPAQVLHVTPSTLALTTLPLALIPTTAVPLAVALHVTSLGRLRRAALSHPAEVTA
jgi:hypothetical protein